MRKKIILSLVLAMVMVFSITMPLLAIDRSVREVTVPYEYQVEWQEEYYGYPVELSDFSEEFQDVMLRIDAVDAYILDVISQMICEGYENELIADVIMNHFEKYVLPLYYELHELTNMEPLSAPGAIDSGNVTRTVSSQNPNEHIVTSIYYTRMVNGRMFGGTIPLIMRRSYLLDGGVWMHVATFRGWLTLLF